MGMMDTKSFQYGDLVHEVDLYTGMMVPDMSVSIPVNKKLDVSFDMRIKALYDYKSKDYFTSTSSQSRVNENKEFSDMINKARKLMK